ncbi:MAG: TPM domain-containing protein [Oscillospiraceae bacterium]|jgi:uncharacterized protein|nr:TPM domain-containing protein [Oscillospiraceae bacterium]
MKQNQTRVWRTLGALLCTLCLLTALALPVLAVSPTTVTKPPVTTQSPPLSEKHKQMLLVDDANLLTKSQENALRKRLVALSEQYHCDVAVVSVPGLDGVDIMNFTDDYFDYKGYGQGSNHDGILFLIAMNERKFWMTTTGFAINAFSDSDLAYMTAQMTPSLKSGNYNKAFGLFADLCAEGLRQYGNPPAVTGNAPTAPKVTSAPPKVTVEPPAVTDNNVTESVYPDWAWQPEEMEIDAAGALLAIATISVLLSLIIVLMLRRRHKSVRFASGASDCVVPGSVQITGNEQFLGTHTSRVRRPDPIDHSSGGGHSFGGGGSSTHTSSSGTSHGGGGGSF